MEAALSARTTQEWLEMFDPIGLPCGPLNTIPQAASMPQVAAREMLVDVPHPRAGSLRVANTPVKLSRTPGGINGPAPDMGADTVEVLSRLLGLSEEHIEALKTQGVAVTGRPPFPPELLG